MEFGGAFLRNSVIVLSLVALGAPGCGGSRGTPKSQGSGQRSAEEQTAADVADCLKHASSCTTNECMVKMCGSAPAGAYANAEQVVSPTPTASPSSGPGSAPLSGALQVVGGDQFGCARLDSLHVKCWGKNDYGQLGRGNSSLTVPSAASTQREARYVMLDASTPLSNVDVIAAGAAHVCALVNLGKVYCWGQNNQGQLGNASNLPSSSPVQVVTDEMLTPLTGVLGISAGKEHSCAFISGGEVHCWGSNTYKQLGHYGVSQNVTHAVKATYSEFDSIAGVVGLSLGDHHSCAVMSDGKVKCWGRNDSQQLGGGASYTATASRVSPVVVREKPSAVGAENDLASVQFVSLGATHSCARVGQTVRCWGSNGLTELGANTSSPTSWVAASVKISASNMGPQADFESISAGGRHTCGVMMSDGSVRCWGEGTSGQLGDGARSNRANTVLVKGVGGTGTLYGVASVGSGVNHTCSVTDDRKVACWGGNEQGALGTPDTATRSYPEYVMSSEEYDFVSPTGPAEKITF